MTNFTSLGILIISMLIVASMKLVPGVFALFYHYASGKYSAKKVSDLTLFFILGFETLSAILFISLNFLLYAFTLTSFDFASPILSWTLTGLFFALSFTFFFFYFRPERGTKLFIGRKTAKNYDLKARNVKTLSDAYILGFISGIPELLFTLPLYFVVFIEATKNFSSSSFSSLLLFLFILLAAAPLFLMYAYFRNGNNLANVERLRIKNKSFFRFFIALLYLLLATTIIFFRIVF